MNLLSPIRGPWFEHESSLLQRTSDSDAANAAQLGVVAAEVSTATLLAMNMMLFWFSLGNKAYGADAFGSLWDTILSGPEDCSKLAGVDKTKCEHRNGLKTAAKAAYALVAPADKNAIWWEVRREFIRLCAQYSA